MNINFDNIGDDFKDGVTEIAETAHIKTTEFHDNYVSKILPDCGKYGDVVKFAAELLPGVSEYDAIVEGDWTAFAISASIDVASIAIGAISVGAGYAAVKGTSTVAKEGVKIAVRETAEASAKKVTKEVIESGVKKAVKETAEIGTEKVVKEVAEVGAEKAVKEVAEATTKKIVKESVEETVEKLDKSLIPDYLKEVQTITNREITPVQMKAFKKGVEGQEFTKLTPKESTLHRKLFDNCRDKLIEEWEKNTGEKWPVYANDVLNDSGEVIRRAGQRYDAHHLIESSYGGPNIWWNMHPAAFPNEHQAGIHSADSMASKMFRR